MTIKLPPLPMSSKLRRESRRDGSVHLVPAYTIAEVVALRREAALMALEEAAKVCSAEFTIEGGALRCYEAIRAMRAELEAS